MPGGRPKKYSTNAAKADAKRKQNREEYARRKNRSFQPQTRPEFVHYAPAPPGAPTATPSDLGLRISADIPIPRDSLIQPGEEERGEDGSRLPSPLSPLAEDDAEAAEVINQLQPSDREQTRERNEYEKCVVQQMDERDTRTAEILLELQNGLAEQGRILQRVSASPVIEEQIVAGEYPTAHTRSVSHASTPIVENRSNTLTEALNSPQTPMPQSVPKIGSPDTPPSERTAYKLAKQLRNFQGCTHEEHVEAERRHWEHHEQPNVHSLCSCLAETTGIISGVHNGGRPLPDVLSDTEPMKKRSPLPEGIDLKAAFEGTSAMAYPEDIGTPNENVPRSLCLDQHYRSSRKGRGVEVTFDVDSVCCFPSSLAFAQKGIDWYPHAYTTLNLDADIHFSLTVSAYGSRDNLTTKNIPLHKIPHYCFGAVAGDIRSLMVHVFFPELRLGSQYKHSTYLSKQDRELWLDAVLLPALNAIGLKANRAKYYPASEEDASLAATAATKERLKIKESAREQILPYRLPHKYLDRLWTCILARIAENPGLSRFNGATLFVNAKNTKLAYMDTDDTESNLVSTYQHWTQAWAEVADPQFYSRDRTFVDIAKEVSSKDYALPYDAVPDDFEAETFLWRRCCLESYARTRVKLLEDGKRARGSPSVTVYPWATMRDTMGQTLSTAARGQENLDGLVYSQFYATIKSPFDVSKVYVFDNQAIENLALDPGYVCSLQQQGGGISFNERKCMASYVHSKNRTASSLENNQRRSYGTREEHRVSLTMMDEICELWQQWDLDDENGIDDALSPLPYYVVPSQELFGFLRAQINKYCLLFEHTLANTGRNVSLQETMVMVIALRALRFCYGSNMLAMESLLFKDRWEQTRGLDLVVREGLGMKQTIANCGLGWFLPKFSWDSRRLVQPHSDNMLVGNLLMHAEYKRRWKAVKDLSDVYTRFHQATQWFTRYSVQDDPQLLRTWLEYLHALNLEQFDADVWSAMLAAHKTHPELSAAAVEQNGRVAFCYRGMHRMFLKEGVRAPPHIVTGNQMRITTVARLLDFLFLWNDDQERKGWSSLPFRLVLQQSFDFIEGRLGYQTASRWLDEYLYLVRLTHWILPYPSSSALIRSSKQSSAKGQTGRMMWFSAVFAHPKHVGMYCKNTNGKKPQPGKPLPKTPLLPAEPSTVAYRLVRKAHHALRKCNLTDSWDAPVLIEQCRKQGIAMPGWDEGEDYWVAGRVGTSKGPNQAVWEELLPPTLLMRKRIHGLSLDELEALMVTFTQEQDAAVSGGGAAAEAGTRTSLTPSRRSLTIAQVFQQAREARSKSGSVFAPSTSSC